MLTVLLAPAALLLIPLLAMAFTEEVNWTLFDFVIAWALLASVGLTYAAVTRQKGGLAYRAAAALTLLTGLALVWGNLAVGFIGSEDNPANLLYLAVLVTGGIGAVLARLRPI